MVSKQSVENFIILFYNWKLNVWGEADPSFSRPASALGCGVGGRECWAHSCTSVHFACAAETGKLNTSPRLPCISGNGSKLISLTRCSQIRFARRKRGGHHLSVAPLLSAVRLHCGDSGLFCHVQSLALWVLRNSRVGRGGAPWVGRSRSSGSHFCRLGLPAGTRGLLTTSNAGNCPH